MSVGKGTTTRSLPQVAGVRHAFHQVGDVKLHVAEAGSGPPLLMLHGWPQHWYEWRHLIRRSRNTIA